MSIRTIAITTIVLIQLSATPAAIAAPWQFDENSTPTRAVVTNENNESLEVFLEQKQIMLEFSTAPRRTPARTSCPTLQIDSRTPLHFYRPGAGCTPGANSVTYNIAEMSGSEVSSLPLYRLANGSVAYLRYVAEDGSYYESSFSLSRSKQAMRRALGAVEIVAGDEE